MKDYKFINKNNPLYILESEEVDGNNDNFFVNYIAYSNKASDELIRILEKIRKNKRRIRIFYGDSTTGKCWHETYDIIGTIGLSTGCMQVPILIANNRSTGGSELMSGCIVQITEDKKVIYKHPGLVLDIGYKANGKKFDVIDNIDGKVIITVNSESGAKKMVDFYSGKSNVLRYS